VDVAQGVHDALDRDASQRPAAERDVETLAREVERLSVVDADADPLALLACQCGACRSHVLGVGIERIDGRGTLGCEARQPTFAAANVEYSLRLRLRRASPRLGLWPIGLDGGSACAVLLCLAAGVFEGGASVGVDELTCFDPLEPVTL
jgi:hypothetical protein